MRALLVAALIGLAAALTAPTAANASACGQRVLQDWRDGRLDTAYPVQCYRDALKSMPEDLRVYGTAQDDIQAALARALARTAAGSHASQHVAAHPAAAGVKPKAATNVKPKAAAKPRAAARTAAPARDRRRTLAGRSATQPRLRLAAAPAKGSEAERFPVVPVVAGALALGAALAVLAVVRGRTPQRR